MICNDIDYIIRKKKYPKKSYFRGKFSEENWFNDYINKETTDILNNVFEEPNLINLNDKIYEKLITGDRRDEILKYKKFDLISPQIYNIVYIYLVYVCNYGKNITKSSLSHYVKNEKEHMKIIEQYNYTPKQYWKQYWQCQNSQLERIDRQKEIQALIDGNTYKR